MSAAGAALVRRVERQRGVLVTVAQALRILGCSRNSLKQRAWRALSEQNPGCPPMHLESIMNRRGVSFEYGGWRVHVQRPDGRRFVIRLRDMEENK